MKKIYSIILFLLYSSIIFCETKYEDLVISMKDVAPNIAFYNYQKYQKKYPKIGNLYFHMGIISYNYLKECNPIKDISSFNYYAYNSKLYLSCVLYFTNDIELRKNSSFYYGIYNGKDNIDKEQLNKYIKIRLDTVARYKEDGENLYNAFCVLSKRYESCISRFYEFNTKYASVNDALLLVTDYDISNLKKLLLLSDSLNYDINNFIKKLEKFPIKGYNPVFKLCPIDLYRVDGLCNVDLLQNEIILYDYATWVKIFIAKYNNRIKPLRKELILQYSNLLNKRDTKVSLSLINALKQIDEESYVADMLQILSIYNETSCFYVKLINILSAEEGIKIINKIANKSIYSEILLNKLRVIDSISYCKYEDFNDLYIRDSNIYDLMIPYINKTNNYLTKGKDFFANYIIQNNSNFDVGVEHLNKIKLKLNLSDEQVLYALRYLDNLFYVFYQKEGKTFIEEIYI